MDDVGFFLGLAYAEQEDDMVDDDAEDDDMADDDTMDDDTVDDDTVDDTDSGSDDSDSGSDSEDESRRRKRRQTDAEPDDDDEEEDTEEDEFAQFLEYLYTDPRNALDVFFREDVTMTSLIDLLKVVVRYFDVTARDAVFEALDDFYHNSTNQFFFTTFFAGELELGRWGGLCGLVESTTRCVEREVGSCEDEDGEFFSFFNQRVITVVELSQDQCFGACASQPCVNGGICEQVRRLE